MLVCTLASPRLWRLIIYPVGEGKSYGFLKKFRHLPRSRHPLKTRSEPGPRFTGHAETSQTLRFDETLTRSRKPCARFHIVLSSSHWTAKTLFLQSVHSVVYARSQYLPKVEIARLGSLLRSPTQDYYHPSHPLQSHPHESLTPKVPWCSWRPLGIAFAVLASRQHHRLLLSLWNGLN